MGRNSKSNKKQLFSLNKNEKHSGRGRNWGSSHSFYQASSDTCALMRSLEVAVVAIELIVPTEVSDSFEPDRDRRAFREEGDSVTLAIGTKMPHLAGQSKYLRRGVEGISKDFLNGLGSTLT